MANDRRPANPPHPNIHRGNRFTHWMAMGVDWISPVRRIGIVLCRLDVGALPFSQLFIHLRSLGFGKCSFPIQLDIQSTAANAVVAA